jgi:hypothetical protein
MRAVPNGDCFIISVGAHLLPHVTKPQVTRWAASVRKRLRLPPTYLGEPERDLVCAYLRCRVGVVHVPMAVDSATGRRYPVAGVQLSPIVPGQDPRTVDYVMPRQPIPTHTDPFGQRGAWTADEMRSFAATWGMDL